MTELRTLDELGKVARGKSKHRPRNDPSLFGGDYPFVQTGDVKHSNFYVTEYSQTYNEKGLAQSKLWEPGTLCITIAANIAETAILGIPACFPDSIIGFIPYKDKADVRFVKYCLETYKLQMQAISQGTTQDNLSLGKLLSIKFRVPELVDTQKKIAAILSTYDDLIENNNRRIALLEQAAEEIYREWFVRMRFPGWETAKFDEKVPVGWKIERLADIAVVVDCPHTKKPREDEETTNKLLHVWNIGDNGRLNLSKTYNISTEDYNLWTSRIEVREGDCIITKTGRVGAVAQIPKGIKAALGRNLVGIRLEKYPNFLIQFLLSPHKDFNVANLKSSGVIMESLHVKAIENFKIQLPTQPLLYSFEQVVGPIRNQIENLTNKNAKLTQTRDLLLSRLISGKLPVDDLDIHFPSSMTETDEPAHA